MRALHVYITTVEDLDSFVNRYIESKDKNNKIVLSTILTNMLDYKEYIFFIGNFHFFKAKNPQKQKSTKSIPITSMLYVLHALES